MECHKRFLAVLTTLFCIFQPAVSEASSCSSLKSLENGQTFFRYRGLFVIFSCRRGYKLHGHKTNSCVSGRWSREPPICVGSGCSSPGPVAHGSFRVNRDASWVVFSCDTGHKLVGPSALYCKGQEWNSSQPVCEESNLRHSLAIGKTAQKSFVSQTIQGTEDPKTEIPSHHVTETAPKSPPVRFDMSNSSTDQTQMYLQPPISTVTHSDPRKTLPVSFPKKLLTFTTTSINDLMKLFQATTVLPSLRMQSTTSNNPKIQDSFSPMTTKTTENVFQFQKPVSLSPISTLSKSYGAITNFASTYETTSSVPAITPENILPSTITAKMWTTDPSAPLRSATFRDRATSQKVTTSSKSEASNDADDLQSLQPVLSSTKSTLTTPLTNVMSENNIFSTVQSKWTKKSEISETSSCPEPPVPTHGNFYFGNKATTRLIETGDHIVYVCAHGFTLAKGDAVRYCQEGATWSGVTPICIDVDECAEEQHHCPHRCINTPGSFLCSCHHGYQPSPDGTSCIDLDECSFPAAVTGCLFGCVNSPGSFHCLCPSGFTTQSPDGHCQDIDECAANSGLGPCSERCHNSPGSFHCSCSYGFTLAGDGLTCISECPRGYRKQPINPQNSTLPTTGRCVDINECEDVEWCEGMCINLPGTFRCICPKGFTLTQDGRRCRDIDECSQNNGGCSHVCINRRGTFKCTCPPSHRPSISSWSKCVPRPSI